MATVWQATIDDLYRTEEKAELVDGELVIMHAGGDWHGTATANILYSLQTYARSNQTGRAYGDNVGFLCNLPHRRSFSPDCAYYIGPRAGRKFLPEAPVFAVEVRSDEDYGPPAENRLARKRRDYFAAGTKVVWDVEVFNGLEIRVYRHDMPDDPTTYRAGDVAEAEPAVPGWTFSVAELLT
jgi:Uma2 family endonuclease